MAGWEVPLNEYFKEPGDEARYEYDFGDGWIHHVLMEGILGSVLKMCIYWLYKTLLKR